MSKTKNLRSFCQTNSKISDFSTRSLRKYGYLTGSYVLPEKGLLEKAATIKRFQYSPLSSGLKKNTAIEKEQYKYLKNQINVINNIQDNVKVKDDVKTDGEITVTVGHIYIGDEFKNLIGNNF